VLLQVKRETLDTADSPSVLALGYSKNSTSIDLITIQTPKLIVNGASFSKFFTENNFKLRLSAKSKSNAKNQVSLNI
jgi:hypothetical protein